jgi:hypothetical protein
MNSIQSAIYDLLKQFVAKQNLTSEVMEKLHPDLMLKSDPQISMEEIYKFIQQYSNIPYTGKYQQWNYWFHGIGCKLIHQLTNEPIEWDAPDTRVFDFYWFVNWLQWYLNWNDMDKLSIIIRMELNEHTIIFQEFIYSVLEQLKEMNLVKNIKFSKYIILSY